MKLDSTRLKDLTPNTSPDQVWWRARHALSSDPIATMLNPTVLDGVASVFTERAWPVIAPDEDPVPKMTRALLPTALSVMSIEARQHLAEVVASAWWPARYSAAALVI